MNAGRVRLVLLASLIALGPGPVTSPPALAGKAPVIFTLTDPRGDDHGDGSLIYPLRDDLKPGDLDLLSLTAREVDGGTEFEATFARKITPPGRRTIDIGGGSLDSIARFGFYTLNLDIYIDTDHVTGSGSVRMLPGRVGELDPGTAWERVICLTPRPFEARDHLTSILKRFSRDEIKKAEGRVDEGALEGAKKKIAEGIAERVFFPTRISVVGPKIRFFVPDSFLGGTAQDSWSYVVAVSGADIEERFDLQSTLGLSHPASPSLMILPIAAGTWADRFGGGREDDELQTPLVDIIVPPGTSQEKILKDYDLRVGRPVRLPGVVPAGKTGS